MESQGNSKVDIITFTRLSADIPVIDVRSPSEYKKGHIPCAVNIPLFDDNEREIVGKLYNKGGRLKALIGGLDLTGPKMSSILEEGLYYAKQNRLLVHCWRGGLRSEAMAWLFSLGGINVTILDGGYKTYRHHVRSVLAEKKKMLILGGMTGSGKTSILQYLKELGHQVIDLEALANHKGSAFGSLGQLPQPTSEHFENILSAEWTKIDISRPVWIEDESRNIGSVFMHDNFFLNMSGSPAVILMMDVKTRLPRLIREYSEYDHEILKGLIIKIRKRLGGDRSTDAIRAVEKGDLPKAIEIILSYYDKTYLYSIKQREKNNVIFVGTETDDVESNAKKMLKAAAFIKL
jgi:tRNA 2-selenouridine synthase